MNDKFRIIVLKSGVLLGDDTLKSALLCRIPKTEAPI